MAISRGSVYNGGNFRVGWKDNFYLPNNEMAKSNGECVEWGKISQYDGKK